MSYVRTMIAMLVALWGVIAWEASQRTPVRPPGMMVSAASAVVEPPDMRRILDRRIGDLKLKDVDLETAIAALRRRANVNVMIRGQEIEDEAEIDNASSRRFSLDLYDATVETALRGILHGLDRQLSYGLTPGGTIIVTSDPATSQHSTYQFTALSVSEADEMTRTPGYYSGLSVELATPGRAPTVLVGYDVRDIAPNPPTPPPLPPVLPPPPVTSIFMSGYSPPHRSTTVSKEQFALIGTIAEFVPVLSDGQDRYFNTGAPAMFAGRIVTTLTPQDQLRLENILTAIRKPKTGAAAPTSRTSADDRAILARRIPALGFDNVTLEEALNSIGEKSRVSIAIRWFGLKKVGIENSARVKIKLASVPLSEAITALMTAAAGEPAAISYSVEGTVLVVSGATFDAPNYEVRVFDVRDLLAAGLALLLQSEPGTPAAGGAAPVSSSRLAEFEHDEQSQFIQLVFSEVDPNVWSDNPPTPEIRIWNGYLFVRQAPAVQNHIETFLEKLRVPEMGTSR